MTAESKPEVQAWRGGTLAANDVAVRRSANDILGGVTLTVKPGEIVAVVGANGAGKSTLLKCLAGALQPDRGTVTIDGEPIDKIGLRDRARRVGYLPQDRTIHWQITCESVVALGRLPYRSFAARESESDRNAIRDAMQRMDVWHLRERPNATLSGGERARVLVARLLAQHAQFLIADEPTAGLDPAHSLAMFDVVQALAADGYAIIVALHDLTLAARYATRVIVLSRGVCIADGPPAQVLGRTTLAAAFAIDGAVVELEGMPVFVPRAPLTSDSRER